LRILTTLSDALSLCTAFKHITPEPVACMH